MDSTWVFNLECNNPPTNNPIYYDNAIIPILFYTAVINRNKKDVINVIKYNPVLTVSIANFYIHVLSNAFYTKKNANVGAPIRVPWKVQNKNQLILNFNEQVFLYEYIAKRNWMQTHFGFLVNTIHNYLITLRLAMQRINNNQCITSFYQYGVNITNDTQMKLFIIQFIPGIRFQ